MLTHAFTGISALTTHTLCKDLELWGCTEMPGSAPDNTQSLRIAPRVLHFSAFHFIALTKRHVCTTRSPGQRFVWELLSLVAEEDRMDLRRYLRRTMDLWAQQGKLGGALVRAICSHTHHTPHQKVVT